MEDSVDVDAFHVPPRSDEATDVQAALTRNKEIQQDHPHQADNLHNQEENHSNEEAASATTLAVLSDVNYPHARWSFNKLLLDISDALTRDDLRRMKSMFAGEIGSGSLEKITDASCLFTLLERRRELSPVHLLGLCALLYFAKRIDLLQTVAEYSRKTENALYIETSSHTPVNGYGHVVFHVAGRDIPTHGDVQSLRRIVSAMLCVPEQFVLIDGASRSSSITITLLLQVLHVTKLQNILEDNNPDVVHLALFGVDTVTIGEKLYHIQAVVFFGPSGHQQQIDLYQELQKAKSALSDTELENLTLKEKLKNSEKKVVHLQAENDVLKRSVKPSELFPDADKVFDQKKGKQTIPDDIETVLEDINGSLGKMLETSYDRQIVLVLLQAHATLIASACHSQLSPLTAISNIQRMNALDRMVITKILTDLQRFTGMDIPDVIQVQSYLRGLTSISSRIAPEEKQKLQQEHEWTEEEKKLLESGGVPFFVMLLRKEAEKASGNREILKDILQKYLSKIDRLDLLNVFEEETRQVVAEGKPQDTGQKPSGNKQEGNEETMDELLKNEKPLIEKDDKSANNLNVMNKFIPSKMC